MSYRAATPILGGAAGLAYTGFSAALYGTVAVALIVIGAMTVRLAYVSGRSDDRGVERGKGGSQRRRRRR